MLRLSEITIKHPSLWEGLVRLSLGGPGWALQLPPYHIIHISGKRGFKGFISYPILNK